jgi:hypothetical protein
MGTKGTDPSIEQIPHLIYRVPKDGNSGRDHERADHKGSDTFQLTMPIGMFIIGGLIRHPHEDAGNYIIRNIGGGVDPLGEKRGAVRENAKGCLRGG